MVFSCGVKAASLKNIHVSNTRNKKETENRVFTNMNFLIVAQTKEKAYWCKGKKTKLFVKIFGVLKKSTNKGKKVLMRILVKIDFLKGLEWAGNEKQAKKNRIFYFASLTPTWVDFFLQN